MAPLHKVILCNGVILTSYEMGLNLLKKIGLCSALLLGATMSVSAQSLLNESFEYAFPPQGWTVVNSTAPGAVNHWERVTYSVISGTGSAHVSSPNYEQAEPVKEEVLITPAVNLNGYYDLNFVWKGATAQSIGKAQPEYDFQVRIREVGSDNWTKIFSFLDEEMVRNSGLAFPWQAWTNNPAAINLTDWEGKNVEIAFVYCLLKAGPASGNDIWIDDVSLTPSQKISGPVAEVSPERYIFPTSFIGVKKNSEVFTLKNTGRDILKVTGVSGLNGTDFGCTLVPSEVSLKTGDTYQFQFTYTPTMTGAANATAVINTNGGDVQVALSGTKRFIPEDAAYEGFEGEVFPPLGWRTTGSWYRYPAGLTGDACAVVTFPDSESSLITPRLDLSGSDPQPFQFTYFEQFDSDNGTEFWANYFKVYLSTDGGSKWTPIFDSSTSTDENGEPYQENNIYSVTLELPANSGDNCYVKFTSEIHGFSMSDYDEIPDYSMIYIDDVLLPSLYGSNAAPASSTPVYPENGATDVFHKNVVLEWTGAQFATNYKLYLGTSATNFNIINGQDMGTATKYEVARLDYNTTYFWKVVAYNGDLANTSAPTWWFSVMADQSVSELPYSENFDEGMPLGWYATNEGYTRWQLSDWQPYGGVGKTPYASGSVVGSKAMLETPEILLPASGETLVSFVWGNAAPVGLKTDPTGQKVNNTTAPNDQSAIYFDIEVDGTWKNLALLSEKGEEKFWYRESFNLSDYAGKPVTFRWRYEVYGYSGDAASIDNFTVELVSADKAMAKFNMDNWDAGYVNNGGSVTSRNPILLSNVGASALKVRSVTFASDNFSSNLAEGTEIAPNRSVAFAVTFNAGNDEGEKNDDMLVAFENGTTVSFPVTGTTLANDVFYYDFESDTHGSTQVKDFTMIDRDAYATVQPVLIYYPNRGAPFAYIVLNCTGDYADWRNVYPVSGEQVLASMGEYTGNYDTDDWMISPRLTATDNSNFRFYAKSYGDSDQVFSQNRVEVLVSTTGKEIANFETVLPSQKIPWSGSKGVWTEYNVDLGQYAGQQIYIAVRHTADRDGFVSFFDDFWFEHFSTIENSIDAIESDNAGSEVKLFNLQGLPVDPASAAPGIYVKIVDGKAVKVIKN